MSSAPIPAPNRALTGDTVTVNANRDERGPQSPVDTVMSGETVTENGNEVVLRVDTESENSGHSERSSDFDLEQGETVTSSLSASSDAVCNQSPPMEDDLETLVGDNDMDLSLSSQDALSDADIPDDISESSSATNTNTNVVQGASEKRPRSFLSKVNPFHTDPDPEEVTEVHTRVLEKTPNGYPRLAAFQSSEANFALYRNFSYLHSRVLLDMQDELTTLEKELDDADREDSYDGRRQMRLHSRTEDVDSYNEYKAKLRRKDERREKREKREAERREMQRQVAENGAPAATTVETDDDDDDDADDATSTASSEPEDYLTRPRREILAEIKCKLYEYDKWMIKSRKMTGFQRPSERNYRSVRRYINNAKPLMDADNDSIRHKEDILSLRNGREWAGFDGFVERSLQIIDQKVLKPILRTEKPPLQNLFRTPELQAKTADEHIHFYSSTRVDAFIGLLITFIIFSLLVCPVVLMYKFSSSRNEQSTFDAVAIMVVFTLLFSAAMSLVTKAARHELFAASAAYCAILVVFIGNLANGGFQ